MAQHRAFRHTGRAARVLQVGDVGQPDLDVAQLLTGAFAQRVPEGDAVGELVAGYFAPDIAQHEIDQQVFREPEQVAHAGCDDPLDIGVVDDLLEDVREVLQDYDALCAGVDELVFQFTGGVQRVDIDHDEPGTERAAHRYRVLEDVRQHDRDTFSAGQFQLLLQVAGKLHRQFVEIPVRDRRSHVGVCRVVRVLLETVLDHLANGSKARRRYLFGYAGRIGLQPDFFHVRFFLVWPLPSFGRIQNSVMPAELLSPANPAPP